MSVNESPQAEFLAESPAAWFGWLCNYLPY
jgi:hypothetical protein